MSNGGWRSEAEEPDRRRRRSSPLPGVVAVVASALAVWLLWGFLPDVAYFFSSRDPIDLGAPGAYHLDAAVANRLVHIRGRLVDPMSATERSAVQDLARGLGGSAEVASGNGSRRTVGRIAGTNLLVDRPGPPGMVDLFEGRLLPQGKRDEYAQAARILKDRGTPLGDGWQVLRDGERPRRAWGPVLGTALLVLLLAVNLRALLRPFLASAANGPARSERPKEHR